MKKLVLRFLLAGLVAFGFSQAEAQIYRNAAGLSIEVGDGTTLAGPMIKHFFNRNNAGQIEVLFGNHVTVVQPIYTYNSGISGAAGLNWLVGLGPEIAFGRHQTDVAIRPMAGLEYKLNGVPLDLSFDWRPSFWLTHGGGNTMGRFGIGMKFTF